MNKVVYGFSMIELLVVLMVVVMMFSFGLPRLLTQSVAKQRQEFLAQMQTIIAGGVVQAIESGQPCQIYFDFDAKRIFLKTYDPSKKQDSFHDNFTEVASDFGISEVIIPDYVVIKNFFIAHNPDEVKGGNVLHEVWLYALPDGTCQPAVINIACQYENPADDQSVGIKISPFLGKVALYENFQTP